MDFKKQITLAVKAGAPLIQIISHDTLRIRAAVNSIADTLSLETFIWDSCKGLRKGISQQELMDDVDTPSEVLEWIIGDNHEGLPTPVDCILLLEDFHPHIGTFDHKNISRLRSFAVAVAGRRIDKVTIIMSQPVFDLPAELVKDTQVFEMPLPNLSELKKLAEQAKQKFELDERDCSFSTEFLNSALGLSTSEAQLAFAKIASEKQRLNELDISSIVREKEQVIRKQGHLEYFHPSATLDDIGGLDNLKKWLKRRKLAFGESAKEFGLEEPRGLLLLGLPGTGKSLAAKAIANAWQLPLLRLDIGKIFGGIVGQSESNMREALQLAETLSPSILWIDEIEKGLSGIQSSGSSDGGTTARVLGSFLTWMQEKKKPVFVVATANNIAQLPPELLRKGRVDEIFFVDLPTEQEREDILKVHLKKRSREDNLSPVEIKEVAQLTLGFTGAELEEVIKEALFMAFDDGIDINFEHIKSAIEVTTPISMTMHELIDKTRSWVKGRAVRASSQKPEVITDKLKSMTRLKSEIENPFE
jgi:SpoVK/Ycf46/Vps4 family AAA+-type ATPase